MFVASDRSGYSECGVLTGAGKAGRIASLVYTGSAGPDHPMHPMLPETRYLKAFAFRV